MRNIFGMALIAGALLMFNPSYAADSDEQNKAVSAAEKWLSLVDGGKYAASWDQSAEFFKANVKKPQWEQQLKGLRAPLGKLISRNLKAAQPATSLPGAPDGQYVVLQFSTTFSNKQEAVETVTPMKQKDGSWRVSGYVFR